MMGRSDIARMIPHAGRMRLLDSVQGWSASQIRCSTLTHRDQDNPLSRHGELPVLAGLEYAAQAMAIHGRLASSASDAPRSGLIASIRDVAWSVGRLDDISGPLTVSAERISGDGGMAQYAFCLYADDRVLIQGRATVLLNAEAR